MRVHGCWSLHVEWAAAMSMTEYWHVDAFKPRLLTDMGSLGQIGLCILETQQLCVSLQEI